MLLSRRRSTTDGAYTGSTSEAVCISSFAQANRVLAPTHLEGHTLALLAPAQLPSGSGVGEHTLRGNKVSSYVIPRVSALATWDLPPSH